MMARRQFTISEKVWIVKNMYRLEYPINVQRLWRKEMENGPPTRPTIHAIMNKFEQIGSVLDIHPPGRPVSITDQNTIDQASEILSEQPQTSTRRISL